MKASDFLELARLLLADGDLTQGDREAKARTVISRAYYAVYLEARDRFFPGESNVKHRRIIQRVATELGVEQAARLRNLYRMRERSDYRLSETISHRDAEECVRIGAELIAMVE